MTGVGDLWPVLAIDLYIDPYGYIDRCIDVVMCELNSCYFSHQAAVTGVGDLWQVLAIDLYIGPYRCRRTI